MQQRALAGARFAHQREPLALGNIEVESRKDYQLRIAGGIAFLEIHGADHCPDSIREGPTAMKGSNLSPATTPSRPGSATSAWPESTSPDPLELPARLRFGTRSATPA